MTSKKKQRRFAFVLWLVALCLFVLIQNNIRSQNFDRSLWQYNLARAQSKIFSLSGKDLEIHPISETSSNGLINFRIGDRYKYGIINDDRKIVVPAILDSTANFVGNYALATFKDKYGIIDRQGKARTPFVYDSEEFVVNLERGYIFAIDNNLIGVVDLEGNTIIPLQYEKIDFSLTCLLDLPNNSTMREENANYALVTKNGKQGIVNLQGNEIVTPQYDRLNPALLKLDYILATKNRKKGIIDFQGNIIVPFEYDGINYVDNIDRGYIIATKNTKEGIVDLQRNIIFPFEYDSIDSSIITKGLAVATKNGKQGVIDLQNNVLVSFEYDSLDSSIVDLGYAITQQENKTGIIDLNDKVIIPFEYESIDPGILETGYGVVRKNGKEGLLGINNQVIIPFEFPTIDPNTIRSKYAILTKGKYQGVMDIHGNIQLPFIYNKINEVVRQSRDVWDTNIPYNNAYIVTKNNRQGVVDARGKTIVPIEYDLVEPNRESYIVTRNNKQGIIDFQGNTIISLLEGKIADFNSQGYGIVTRNNKQGVVDLQGNIFIPFQYDEINYVNLDRGYVVATKGGLQGVIDLQGKILLPFKYDSITTRFYESEFLWANKDDLNSLYNLNSRSIVLTGLKEIVVFLSDANYYAVANKNGKQGVININGKIHIPFEYDGISQLSRNLGFRTVFTAKDGKRGVIDFDYGNILIPAQYDRIDYINIKDDYGIVTKDGQDGIYDPKFDRFTPLSYDEIELLSADEYYLAVNLNKDVTEVKDSASLLKEGNKTRLLLKDFYSTEFKYAIVTKNNQQGVLNVADGGIVVPIKYDTIIANHNSNYAIATKQNKKGILNIEDNTFVVIKSDELNGSLLDRGYVIFAEKGKQGIADLTGKIIIPAEFNIISDTELQTTDIELIKDSYLIANKNGESGLLNLKNKKFLALDYDTISNSSHYLTLNRDRLIAYKDKQAEIIDLKGNPIVSLKDKPIYIYQNGVVVYRSEDSFDFNRQAYLAIPDTTANRIKDKGLFINNLAILTVEGKYSTYSCVINQQGELLVKSQHHNWGAREKIDNLCRSLVGIDVDNTAIRENPRPAELGTYDFYLRGGLLAVKVNNKWGFVNKKGDFVIYPQFDRVFPFSEDLAVVKIDNKYGYINKSGEIATAPQFDKAGSFFAGFAKVIQDGKKNFIDKAGKTILDTTNYPKVSEKEALRWR